MRLTLSGCAITKHACAQAQTETVRAAEVHLEHECPREPNSEDTIALQLSPVGSEGPIF